MRSLAELVHPEDAGAEEVRRLLATAVNPVEVIRGDRARGERSLLRVQEDTSTLLGAVAYRLGGLVFDHGWLRVLGSGASRHPRGLDGWNGPAATPRLPGATLVADDVVGGFFAVARPQHRVHYFAPDTLTWDDMEIDYRGLLQWACNGDLDAFYIDARWPGWERAIMGVGVEQGIALEPPLSVEAAARAPGKRVAIDALWQAAAQAWR